MKKALIRISLLAAFAFTAVALPAGVAHIALTGTGILAPSLVQAQDVAPDINVKVDKGGGTWFVDPTFLVIGGIVLLLVIALIAFASRGGGGTTVIHDK
jgi:hypothetical protein